MVILILPAEQYYNCYFKLSHNSSYCSSICNIITLLAYLQLCMVTVISIPHPIIYSYIFLFLFNIFAF